MAMLRFLLCLLLVPMTGCGGGEAGASLTIPARRVACQVVGIMDGDTIKVRVDGVQTTVRLEGIDAPERKQAYGTKAKEQLAALLEGKAVSIVPQGKDRYGRVLARVMAVGGMSKSEIRNPKAEAVDVNVAMVRSGYAWQFVRYDRSAELAAAQRDAAAAKRGLWQDPEPVAPWVWRKRK